MIETKRIVRVAGILGVMAAGCLVVAFLRRHHVEDSLPGIEGAYFSRSVGQPAYAGVFNGTMFEPFRPLNAYLWLGAGIGLSLASVVLAAVARLARTDSGAAA